MSVDDMTFVVEPSVASARNLNDRFRRSFVGGRIVMTADVAALPPPVIADLVERIRSFDDFDVDNDPHGEHDFGAVSIAGARIFWKIDCFNRALRLHSPDTANPAATRRVLTVMLATEY